MMKHSLQTISIHEPNFRETDSYAMSSVGMFENETLSPTPIDTLTEL